MNKPKILFVTRSSENGGEAIIIKKLYENLKEKFEFKTISLLDMPKNYKKEEKIFLKPKIILKKPWISLKDLSTIKKEIKKVDLSQHFIFDFHSIIFFFLCFFYNQKIIVTFHTNITGGKKSRHLINIILKFFLVNLLIIFASKFLFITNAQKLNFRKCCLFKKTFDKKSRYIYNFLSRI